MNASAGGPAERRNKVRRVALCVAFTVLFSMGVAAWSVSASQASISPDRAQGFRSPQGPLVVPAVQALDQAQQVLDAVQARRETPQAFFRREASHTAYAHLNAAAARNAARDAFPRLIDVPNGGPPALRSGAKIIGYPADNVASVVESNPAAPHGLARSVIETAAPIALETSPRHRSPIDLQLQAVGDTYRPKLPLVAVKIPKRLAKGIALGDAGISLTPVTAQGRPLTGSEGTVDGTTVMYANTLASADTVVKPDSTGFSAETLLRSLNSPRTLQFEVSLPAADRLVGLPHEGGAEIVTGTRQLVTIPRPTAQDAEGTPVPVSMTVSGRVLSIKINESLRAYRLPIVVDPTVEDKWWRNEERNYRFFETNWHFEHSPGAQHFTAPFQPEGPWTETIGGNHTESEWGGLFYTTQGESQITEARMEGSWTDSGARIQNYMVLETKQGLEDYQVLPETAAEGEGEVCLPSLACYETIAGGAPPENGNTVGYEQVATRSGEGTGGSNTVTHANVRVSQEQPPTIEFNKSTLTLYNKATNETVPNVLYGAGEWLGPHHGAFEVRAKDPGLGIDYYKVVGSGIFDWREFVLGYDEGGLKCLGIQCPATVNQGYLYNSAMADGEDGYFGQVEDPVKYRAELPETPYESVKVDGTPPTTSRSKGSRTATNCRREKAR
jgi:hypothetical protein